MRQTDPQHIARKGTGSFIAARRWMLLDDARLNDVTGAVLAAAIEVHRILGPGLLESTYLTCLEYELNERRLGVVCQHPLTLTYKGLRLDSIYRIDLVVEDLASWKGSASSS